MTTSPIVRQRAALALLALVALVALLALLALRPAVARAQHAGSPASLLGSMSGAAPAAAPAMTGGDSDVVERITLAPGRSRPLAFLATVTKVAVADTNVVDVVVVGAREVLVNGKKAGESDVLLWTGTTRRHFRVAVGSADDRLQVVLAVKFAEVRRDALTSLGVSARARNGGAGVGRIGTGAFNTDQPFDASGRVTLPNEAGFFTILSDLGTRNVLAFIDAQEQRGTARILAEPTLMAANREEASFLAGGEIPIPIAQPGAGGQTFVTIVFREFGVRLSFVPEILSDSLVKLHVQPEVSSLDYSNALVLSGVRVPALRSRKLASTIDVRRDEGIIISGLLNDEREQVRTGVPLLMNVPLLGRLFSSNRWQKSESELLVVVTPTIVDPNRPRPRDTLRFAPDSTLPAREAIEPRLPRDSTSTSPAKRP